MMDTQFYNESVKLGSVAASVLFKETSPPRNFSGFQNMGGPNDNVFVNTYQLGGQFRAVTDSSLVLDFDAETLQMGGKVKWQDKMDSFALPSSSAHPLPHPAFPGCILDFEGESGLQHKVSLYKLCHDAPSTRSLVGSYTNHYLPYFHSWGLTQSSAVFLHQHFSMNFEALMAGKTVDQAFSPQDAGKDTTIVVMPLDSSASATTYTMPGELYYTHVINSFENATHYVLDLAATDENAMQLIGGLDLYLNKTARDSVPDSLRISARRITMPKGSTAAAVDIVGLRHRSTDFPKVNPHFIAKPYCMFWAVEWFHDDVSYGCMAVVRQNLCTGETVHWYQANAFPSEPTVVPGQSGKEDDVTLLFSLFDGTSKTSSLVAVDGSTMQTVAKQSLPQTIGFTTHGQFYPGPLNAPR